MMRGRQQVELGLDVRMQAAKLGLDAHNAEADRRNRNRGGSKKRSNSNGQRMNMTA